MLIEFIIPNFYIPEFLKTNIENRYLSSKSPSEFVFLCCWFTKVIMQSKSWFEMFVLKLYGIQNILQVNFLLSFKTFKGIFNLRFDPCVDTQPMLDLLCLTLVPAWIWMLERWTWHPVQLMVRLNSGLWTLMNLLLILKVCHYFCSSSLLLETINACVYLLSRKSELANEILP